MYTSDFAGARRYGAAVLGCACLLIVGIAGCAASRPSALTPGAAKKNIVRGETTMAEVIEVFGTPNIVTQKREGEMWVYDKVSSKQTCAAFGAGGLGGGWGSSGFGGGGIAGGVGSAERSETTVMLIIYFDRDDKVLDYKLQQTKF
jgi:outer membrane protein assembly factor BamE (lipoprotein component of BamABCDE complex)